MYNAVRVTIRTTVGVIVPIQGQLACLVILSPLNTHQTITVGQTFLESFQELYHSA